MNAVICTWKAEDLVALEIPDMKGLNWLLKFLCSIFLWREIKI
jgi:hypothetical protein